MVLLAINTTPACPITTATRTSATDAVRLQLVSRQKWPAVQMLKAELGCYSRSKTRSCSVEISLLSPKRSSPFPDLLWHVIADRATARPGSGLSSRGAG